MESTHPAGAEANTSDPRAAHNGERPRQNGDTGGPAYPNNTNERGGAGSPYGGTQSPDAAAPDGNQTPRAAENTSPDETRVPGDLGSEYAEQNSYGDAPPPEGYGGTEPKSTDTDAAGTPVR